MRDDYVVVWAGGSCLVMLPTPSDLVFLAELLAVTYPSDEITVINVASI